MYEIIYGAVADFFTMMGNMADIFDLPWIKETIRLFSLFGWTLFVAGFVVAIFDVAIEYQCGRANIRTTSINILKGFFACSLIGVVPAELYKFCISLQNTFSRDLISVLTGGQTLDLAGQSTTVLEGCFAVSADVTFGLLNARYNPFADTLRMECEIDSDSPENNHYFDYEPTAAEAQLIKEMMTEKIQEAYGQTPQEFCQDAWGESFSMGGQV